MDKKLELALKTVDEVIEQRDWLMNMTKINRNRIDFFESEVSKLTDIANANTIVLKELAERKNIYKKQ
tara:strand:+ start:167 stop:370 length:204 start_codon:yes stop_codon:yes gene_type:complete